MTRYNRTHEKILEAAYVLFLEKGYAAASMRQIAAKAGLSLGGIYNHFSNKDAIFIQLINERHPYRQILPILLGTPVQDIETFVRRSAQTVVDELGKHPDFIKLMLIELVEFKGSNMPRIIDEMLPQVLPLIEQFDNSQLRPIPPFVLFRAFLGLFFSYYMTELILNQTPAAEFQPNALENFVDIFLHGVLADKERA